MKSALLINSNHLKPLLREDWDQCCASCSKDRARWMFFPKGEEQKRMPVCALCWLYESSWGKNRKEEIAEFRRSVESEVGKDFLKSGGQLVRCEDADRLLSAIALTSHLFAMRSQQQGASP